jgi:hypothetical protein
LFLKIIARLFFRGDCGAIPAEKNRAFRSNSSDLPMQILWDFRFNPWRPTGFSRYAQFNSA